MLSNARSLATDSATAIASAVVEASFRCQAREFFRVFLSYEWNCFGTANATTVQMLQTPLCSRVSCVVFYCSFKSSNLLLDLSFPALSCQANIRPSKLAPKAEFTLSVSA